MGALLDDSLQGPLCFGLQVFTRVRVQINSQKPAQHVGLGEGARVVGGVATELTQGPSSGCLEMVLRLIDQS